MKFVDTELAGVHVIDIEPLTDERGMFARSWCQREFSEEGLTTSVSQCSLSFNPIKGTLRGMHYQGPPNAETRIVRCTRGAAFDVVIDLRRESASYKRWFGVLLTEENHRMIYIPEGIAHGFITIEPNTELFYQISTPYAAESVRGIRWNDPAFGVVWPLDPAVISQRDATFPDFKD
jgi:dTDP-4-dehydrorhamnose 3,5-epimerase